MNFDLGLASFIVDQLKAESAFEFGTGIGLYVDYLVRHGHVPGRVIGAEPEDMSSAGVYSADRPSPRQLTGNLLDPSRQKEREELGEFDVVYTIEVAEHIDPSQLPLLVDFLASIVGRYIVFSAARPNQVGTGHIPGSMLQRQERINKFEATGKVVFLPNLSSMLLEHCDDRNLHHKINPTVFGKTIDLDTDVKSPDLKRSGTMDRREHEEMAYELFVGIRLFKNYGIQILNLLCQLRHARDTGWLRHSYVKFL